jgi:hypothetical protein
MGRGLQLLAQIAWIIEILTANSVWAYVPTITSTGAPIRWKSPIKINFAGNPTNVSNLNPKQFFDAAVMGLQRWKSASSGVINFDYWQGTNTPVFTPDSTYNGLSSIYFASNSLGDSHLSQNVLGMTQVWYNTDSGEILETDIVLNDRDFNFTDNPTDTSGYGSGASTFTRGKNNVYIQNVLTHELGHSFGLSHSGGLQSTMLFMESPEQAHLGCDELIAVHALYPTQDQGLRGSITGRILSEKNIPVFGAHILAISQRRGTVLATEITDRNGQFTINALEPGSYFLMTEPFYAGPQALPAYYSESNSSFCPEGSPFGRSFLTKPDGFTFNPILVSPSKTTQIPDLIARCSNTGGASVIRTTSLITPNSPSLISFDGNYTNQFGIIDQIKPNQVLYYELPPLSGRLEVHALSYSLYSPLQSSISLISENETTISTQVMDPVYRGESGYVNRDSALIADDLPLGKYYLRVSSMRLQANDFPAGPISLDSVPFLVITGSINEGTPALSDHLPNNARCRSPEAFPDYLSPPGLPPRNSVQTEQSGGCGTIQDQSKPSGPSNGAASVVGWFLPWIFMLLSLKFWTRLQRAIRPVKLKL